MSPINWQGVYPALLTPFTDSDKIDVALFQKNLSVQLEAGVHGIILGGSLGEASTLTFEEKNELLKISVDTISGRVPVVINIAEQTTRDAVKVAQSAEKNGAQGLMLLPPMRYRSDDFETLEYFRAIAASTDLPIMIYNNPHDYKIEITLDMFEELSVIPTIKAIKESTRDISYVTRLKNRFNDRYKILCGVDTLAYEELALGADGWVAGLVDAFPHETVAIYELMKAGKFSTALPIYRWFFPLLELDIHPKFVQYIKLAATMTGIGSEHVRAPRLKLSGNERNAIVKIVQDALASRSTITQYMDAAVFENVTA